MAAVLSLTPIAPGKADEWRALHAELMGARRVEWAQSQRRRGVTRQVVSLVERDRESLAVVFTEAHDPEAALASLRSSSDPFDQWLVERLDAVLETSLPATRILDTAPRPGPWRGWRGRWR
ncbi:MAG: hypothetical protein A2Z12_06995 [Actinobacteria bacterium RBG_16_68_21]|nr:MAG: hypothetical protein A2Z12_06995 [Actinobacteria bacterium RBG_16_68_21]